MARAEARKDRLPTDGKTLHASCAVVGEAGILIEGVSGAGKSTLARELVTAARQDGRFARFVSDDRTRVEARHGRVIARAVAGIAGSLEIRGLGIVKIPHEPSAIVRLAVYLSSDEPTRLPSAEEGAAPICGIMVPRLFLRSGAASAAVVLARLGRAGDAFVTL